MAAATACPAGCFCSCGRKAGCLESSLRKSFPRRRAGRRLLGKHHLCSISSVEEMEHGFLQWQRESNLCLFSLHTGHLNRPQLMVVRERWKDCHEASSVSVMVHQVLQWLLLPSTNWSRSSQASLVRSRFYFHRVLCSSWWECRMSGGQFSRRHNKQGASPLPQPSVGQGCPILSESKLGWKLRVLVHCRLKHRADVLNIRFMSYLFHFMFETSPMRCATFSFPDEKNEVQNSCLPKVIQQFISWNMVGAQICAK